MECTAVLKILDASADGELDLSTQIEVDSHLEQCAQCAAQLGFTLAMKSASKAALQAHAPPDLRAEILRSLEASDAPPKTRRWKAAAVATGLAAMAVGAFALRANARLEGVELVALHRDTMATPASEVDRRPEAALLVGESNLEVGGQQVVHRHYRLGSSSFSVLSSRDELPIDLADQGDVRGAAVQHETLDGTTVAAALVAPRFVVMSRDPVLAIEFAALNLLQRLAR